jgi:hypothetical protein
MAGTSRPALPDGAREVLASWEGLVGIRLVR